jgi:gamma-glutamylputrescine oxidase
MVPAATFVMTTPPLGERLTRAVAVPYAIYDLKLATNYYRVLPDGALLWGGRVLSWQPSPAAIERALRRDMEAMYPSLRGVPVDVAWSGLLPFLRHRLPVVTQVSPGVWVATGFGGHGLALTTMAGRLIGAAIGEGDDRWRLFADLGLPFAAGPASRVPAQAVFWGEAARHRLSVSRGLSSADTAGISRSS